MSKRKRHGSATPPASGASAVTSLDVAAQAQAEAVEAQIEEQAQPRDFVIVRADDAGAPTSPRELLQLMKAWRHGRATRTIWDALSDGYVAVICIAVFGAMIVNLILKAQHTASACASPECLAGRTILPWVVAAALGSLALALSHLFGPVLASAAEGFWLLDAPVDRRRVLAKRLVAALALALVGGALVGALTALFTGGDATAIVAWTAACALGAGGLVALAAALQGLDHTRPLRWLQSLLSLIAVAALVLVAALAAGWVELGGLDARNVAIPLVIAVVGTVLLIAGAVVAAGRLNQLRRTRLVSGGALVSGMQGAMFGLDFGLMRDILVEREARDRGHVRSAPGRGQGTNALIWRDVHRLVRFPRPLLAWVVSLVVPYALTALGVGVLVPLLSGLALTVVLVPMLGSLRVLTRTPGLARMMPFTRTQLRTAAMTVPGVLALLWGLATVPAYLGYGSGMARHGLLEAVELGVVTGLAGLNGAIRWTSAKQVNFETPMMATSAGAVPPSMIFNLFRGLDMVAVTTALIIFGVSPVWSLAIGVIVLLILRSGGMSREELEEAQKRNQRELEEQKAARQREKIRVPR